MTESQIEAMEGQLLQGTVAWMLGWTNLTLGKGEWSETLFGTPPGETRRSPVPPYHASVDACLADVVPWMRETPRGFEVTIATNEEVEATPYAVVWFTRRLGEDEIEVCARAGGSDLSHTVPAALCRAALLAWIRVAGEGGAQVEATGA